MTLEIGSLIINRYRIDAVIAHGGMGAIYRAFDHSLGVQVALKENLYGTEESTRQFRREATLLAGLRHPNLPRVTDHFTFSDQGQYLVMDFIEGEDLRKQLATSGPLREDEVVTIGAAVCEALQYLHTRKPAVVHRDIKPGNIKITPSGQVFLVDFGLAKMAVPGQATTTGAQALTPGYAPPEQYGQGTTPLSDLYALGATLYAALTGKIPEDGLARAMGSAHLTPLRKYKPTVTERTAQVIEKAMAVHPEDRYPTAEDFRMALLNSPTVMRASQVSAFPSPENASEPTVRRSSVLVPPTQSFPTVATPQVEGSAAAASQPLPSRTAARRGLPVWLVILLLVVILGTAAGGVFLSRNNSQAVPLASPTVVANPPTLSAAADPPTSLPVIALTPTASPRPTSPPSQTPSPTLLPPTATITLTPTLAATLLGGGGGQIAFVSIREGKRPQIWLVNPDGSSLHALTDIGDGACQPAWSPDGERLAFITPCARQQEEYAGATLFLINADGSNAEPLPSLPGGDFDPAWSPDGTLIAFTSLRESVAHIFTISVSDHKVVRLTGAFSDDRRAAWSPDGKRIAFESTRLGQKQIWLMGAKGESQAEFTRLTEGPALNPVWSADSTILFYTRDTGLPTIFARRTDVSFSPESQVTDLRPVIRPRLSKDGQWLTFESWSGSNHDIFLIRTSGTGRQQVTKDAAYDFDPVWKP